MCWTSIEEDQCARHGVTTIEKYQSKIKLIPTRVKYQNTYTNNVF